MCCVYEIEFIFNIYPGVHAPNIPTARLENVRVSEQKKKGIFFCTETDIPDEEAEKQALQKVLEFINSVSTSDHRVTSIESIRISKILCSMGRSDCQVWLEGKRRGI